MIYLDHGATSMGKPRAVKLAVGYALDNCANPGRGGYPASMAAAETVLRCRVQAARLFDCQPEQVVMTHNCTHGLNIAISSLVKPGDPVVISGFEHNSVVRPLHGLGARVQIAGRRLFDWEDTLEQFDRALRKGAAAAVFTHVSNVFGYVLPVEQLSALCRQHGVPFIVDAAQAAGAQPVSLRNWGAAFVAMPGHKGLLGPQGTGLLLCTQPPKPLLYGGTGSLSEEKGMPDFLPDTAEAGTLNVPGIAGLSAGLAYLQRRGIRRIGAVEAQQAARCCGALKRLGLQVFSGPHQSGTFSFLPKMDCERAARLLAQQGIAVRAGLHCAPLAHESAGTLDSGTVRISFGPDAGPEQTEALVRALRRLKL